MLLPQKATTPYLQLFLLAIVIIGMTAGCASTTHLTKSRALPAVNGNTILIDAKQRAITNAVVDGKLRMCAEPSPDALSTLAAGGGLSLSKADVVDLAANATIAEGAASIGLRTQSIQLMRDAMYRLCEGYVSGALDDVAFETLQRRFQSSMVAILAIEQVTGVVRAPAVVLGGSASQGNAQLAADLTAKTEAAREAVRKAEAELTDKQAALAKAKTAREALEKEEADLKKKETPSDADKKRLAELPAAIKSTKDTEAAADASVKQATTAKADRDASYQRFDAARLVALAGGGQAAVVAALGGTEPPASDVAAAVAAVQGIVESTLNLEFGRELCTTVLTRRRSTNEQPFSECVAYLGETVAALRGRRDGMASLTADMRGLLQAITRLVNDGTADAAKLKAAADALAEAQKLLTSTSPQGPPLLMVD